MEDTDELNDATTTTSADGGASISIASAGPVLAARGEFVCRFKECRRTEKPDDDASNLLRCAMTACDHVIHQVCLVCMLAGFWGEARRVDSMEGTVLALPKNKHELQLRQPQSRPAKAWALGPRWTDA